MSSSDCLGRPSSICRRILMLSSYICRLVFCSLVICVIPCWKSPGNPSRRSSWRRREMRWFRAGRDLAAPLGNCVDQSSTSPIVPGPNVLIIRKQTLLVTVRGNQPCRPASQLITKYANSAATAVKANANSKRPTTSAPLRCPNNSRLIA
jgi:hypothetical protein